MADSAAVGIRISALICTRNGSRTLGRAIAACERALATHGASGSEILVVDNDSSDDTRAIVLGLSSRSQVPIRLLSASPAGKTNAFYVGVRHAACELITIVDDDVYVEHDFFRLVAAFFEAHSEVGIIGSANRLADLVAVPDWFACVASTMYACGDPVLSGNRLQLPEGRVTADFSMPPGAGMTFRRDVLVAALDGGFRFFNDTERSKRITGEDTELCMVFWSLGWRFGFDPRLRLQHDLDPARLTAARHRDIVFAQGAGGVAVAAFLQSRRFEGERPPLRLRWQWQAARATKVLLAAMLRLPMRLLEPAPRRIPLPGGVTHA